MANTFDPSLVNTVLANRAITKLNGRLAYLPAFCADFSDQILGVRSRSINVPFVSGGSIAIADTTDFEVGDTDVVNRQVNLQHISKTAYITQYDLEQGRRLEWLADNSINAVANKIESMVFALITEANFGAAVATWAAGTMSLSSIQTLWGALPGATKNFLAADSEYKNLLASNLFSFQTPNEKRAYGFDYFDHAYNAFTFAGAGIKAFAAAPQAIVMAAALPEMSPQVSELLDTAVVTVPELGLSFQSNLWGSSKTRSTYHSFDLLFGASIGDNSALKVGKTV
jgi:hypothetical protein